MREKKDARRFVVGAYSQGANIRILQLHSTSQAYAFTTWKQSLVPATDSVELSPHFQARRSWSMFRTRRGNKRLSATEATELC